MSFDFLTKELGIPVEKLSVTCFAGDEDCPRDNITAECWKKAGIPEERDLFSMAKMITGGLQAKRDLADQTRKCFMIQASQLAGQTVSLHVTAESMSKFGIMCSWSIFKDKNGYSKLKQRNVDTGLGLERMTMLLEGKETPFDTELFAPIMEKLQQLQKSGFSRK